MQTEQQQVLDPGLLLSVLTAAKKGDFSVRLPLDWIGVNGKIADSFNDIVEMNQRMAKELERVGESVGREGRIDQRADAGGLLGAPGPAWPIRSTGSSATW